MEIWFASALIGAVLAGVSNFYFKLAASRNYNAEVFTLWGAVAAVTLTGMVLSVWDYTLFHFNQFAVLMLLAGVIASLALLG